VNPWRLPIWTLLALFACSGAEPEDTWDELPLHDRCFEGLGDESRGLPDYDQFDPVVGRHCSGTDHQDIDGVEQVVFLGDSVTVGTPPTTEVEFYRTRLLRQLEERFGPLASRSCAEFGARNDDLLLPPRQQILECFPATQDLTTLVVMTMGGNDMFAAAEDMRDGASAEAIMADVARAGSHFRDAIAWFDDNASLFPAGVFVVFGTIYEFTDGEGDLGSCPGAQLLGFSGTIPEMRDAYIAINEEYVSIAVDTQRDVIFMLMHFCGHGFHAGDPDNECYRGPDAETWFDGTCLHPTSDGHRKIAEMFFDVVSE